MTFNGSLETGLGMTGKLLGLGGALVGRRPNAAVRLRISRGSGSLEAAVESMQHGQWMGTAEGPPSRPH
jgi:hypothetical protein